MTFGPQTKVTLGVAISCAIGIGCSLFYAQQALAQVQQSLDVVARDVKAIQDDKYTLSSASEYALRLAIANPGMKVPDPRVPDRVICVEVPQ